MSDFVTRAEFNRALDQVRTDIRDTERRLRGEWKQLDEHLDQQDTKLAWLLGVFVAGLISLIVWLADYAITHPH